MELKIEYVDINSIKPYKNNAKYFVYIHIFPNNKKYIGKCDIEAIRRGAKKRMGANAYNSRKVIQCDKKGNKINIYDSLADAYRTTNTRVQDIYNCCKGRQKTANEFIWKYYD